MWRLSGAPNRLCMMHRHTCPESDKCLRTALARNSGKLKCLEQKWKERTQFIIMWHTASIKTLNRMMLQKLEKLMWTTCWLAVYCQAHTHTYKKKLTTITEYSLWNDANCERNFCDYCANNEMDTFFFASFLCFWPIRESVDSL